jgi:predicted TIM-barrel fold metal-dependent hydrolase
MVGACDCHAHVFPDGAPVVAPARAYRTMLDSVGLTRGVLVQTGAGDAALDAVRAAIEADPHRLRGVAVADSTITDATLEELHAAGIRGLRFAEMPHPSGHGRFPNSVGTDEFERLAPRLRALGWHAELWTPSDFIAREAPRLAGLGVPLVFDHLGLLNLAAADPALDVLSGLLRDDQAWVKLSLCRVSKLPPDYTDARAAHDAFIEANPHRLVWGSDWPHINMGLEAPDVGHLLDLFHAWVDDAALRQAILVEGPEALYGFPPTIPGAAAGAAA